MASGNNPKKPFQRFLPYPKHITPEEKKEWEWYEKKRPKFVGHNWMFRKWLREKNKST